MLTVDDGEGNPRGEEGGKRMQCPSCEAVEIETTSSDKAEVAVYPRCGRHFRVISEGQLVEAWPGPLSLVLYPVIFERRPQKEAERIPNELRAAYEPGRPSIFRPFSRDELRQVLVEIRMELERPTQNGRDILDLRGDEADLRAYLTLVADRLDILLGKSGSAG